MRPKLKLLLMLAVSTWILIFTDHITLGVISAASFALLFYLRIYRKYIYWAKPLLIIVAMILLIQSFTYAGIGFSVQGLREGALYSVRFMTLLALASLFIHTTGTRRMADAFGFLPASVSEVLVLALALLPGMEALTGSIINAQKARGHSFRSPNIFRTYFPILVPLFGKTLERSGRMALAMEARGYGAKEMHA